MATVNNVSLLFLSSTWFLLLTCSQIFISIDAHPFDFTIEEATISDIHRGFAENKLTSRQLVDFYLRQIETLNPLLRGVLEVNPDAQDQADEADRQWHRVAASSPLERGLLGIPVLLKDTIATKDKLNTTAGSYALLGSKATRDAGVVERLRSAGAVILGKATLSEWYGLRSSHFPPGWCARAGQGLNPYVLSGGPCGSSSGSAISVAANMAAVSLGTETDGSIICPADHNSVVGLKPTVGLTSRTGVVPVSPGQDTVGPICRTVSDAVYVLDAIVGYDPQDGDAAGEAAAKFIPVGGYKQYLKEDGLRGKRLGIVRNPFLNSFEGSIAITIFEGHLKALRDRGAIIVDNLQIANVDVVLDPYQSGEALALIAEFKIGLNEYLHRLMNSPVRSLADIIAFNMQNPYLEKTTEYGQENFMAAEASNWTQKEVEAAAELMKDLSENGFEKLMADNELDTMVTLGWGVSPVLAVGGYPAISVPAGYEEDGMPFGICFGGLRGSEPKLIEIAHSFEQATKARRPPPPVSDELISKWPSCGVHHHKEPSRNTGGISSCPVSTFD